MRALLAGTLVCAVVPWSNLVDPARNGRATELPLRRSEPDVTLSNHVGPRSGATDALPAHSHRARAPRPRVNAPVHVLLWPRRSRPPTAPACTYPRPRTALGSTLARQPLGALVAPPEGGSLTIPSLQGHTGYCLYRRRRRRRSVGGAAVGVAPGARDASRGPSPTLRWRLWPRPCAAAAMIARPHHASPCAQQGAAHALCIVPRAQSWQGQRLRPKASRRAVGRA